MYGEGLPSLVLSHNSANLKVLARGVALDGHDAAKGDALRPSDGRPARSSPSCSALRLSLWNSPN